MSQIETKDFEKFRRETDISELFWNEKPDKFIDIITNEFSDEKSLRLLRSFLIKNIKPSDKVKRVIEQTTDRMYFALEIMNHFAEKVETSDTVPMNHNDHDGTSYEDEVEELGPKYDVLKTIIVERIRKNNIEPTREIHATTLVKNDIVCIRFSYDIETINMVLEMYLVVTRVNKLYVFGTYYVQARGGEDWLVSGEFSLPTVGIILQGNVQQPGKPRGGSRPLGPLLGEVLKVLPEKHQSGFRESFISKMFLVTDEKKKDSPSIWNRLFSQK